MAGAKAMKGGLQGHAACWVWVRAGGPAALRHRCLSEDLQRFELGEPPGPVEEGQRFWVFLLLKPPGKNMALGLRVRSVEGG